MNKLLLLIPLLLVGCGVLPLRPGKAFFKSPSGWEAGVVQSQNPKQETTQEYERTEGGVTEKVKTKIGAAQKDTAREIGARLASLKWVVWVGIAVFLFGAASAFYPPLKLIVGSTTTSVAACAAGVALIFLPNIIVGHELIIFCVALGAVGIYWFAHRHGHLRGQVSELIKKV
jgi:hypothetical protein